MSPTRIEEKNNRLWWFPSVEVLLFSFTFFLSLFVMPILLNGDGDLGRHITIGNILLKTHQMLHSDILSHTMYGKELILHEWGSDLLFALIHHWAGLNGIAWFTASTIAGTYALFTAGLKKLNIRTPIRLLAGTTAMLVGTNHWHTRPHIITTFFFAYLILVLFEYYQNEDYKILIPLPILMIFWANLHGAFITALVQIGLLGIGLLLEKRFSAVKTVFIIFVAATLASLINPFGVRMITHSFGYLQLKYLVDFTNEYNSPNFHHSIIYPYLGVLLLTTIMGWRSKTKANWVSLLFLFFWTGSSLYSARNIPLYGLVAALFGAQQLEAELKNGFPAINQRINAFDKIGQRAWGWMWGIAFAIALIVMQMRGSFNDVLQLGNQYNPAQYPVAAIATLEKDGLPQGNIFNEFGWGGYLLYRFDGKELVFIDGQTDFYGEDLTRTYEQILNGEGDWQTLLDDYQIDWVLLPPNRTLSKLLAYADGWENIYADETTVVFVRK